MKQNRILIELEPKEGRKIDFVKFISQLSSDPSCVDLSDYTVFHIQDSPIDAFRADFLDYLTRYGLYSFLTRGPLLEAHVPTGTPTNAVVNIFQLYLESLPVTDELLVVDPYFFPSTHDSAYPQILYDILRPHYGALRTFMLLRIRVTTKPLPPKSRLTWCSPHRISTSRSALRKRGTIGSGFPRTGRRAL